jgi:sporulation protein YlmC with PRC-barrel domain
MTHYRALGTQRVSDDVRDVRGTTIRRSDGVQVGKVDDVILDHETMEIRYLVVGDADWPEAGIFVLPAERVSVDENHEDGLATGATTQQVENAPQYGPGSLRSADEWTKYEREFKKYWEEQPVMHMKDSYRIVTPPEEPAPTQAGPINEGSRGSGDRVADAGKLFPERMTSVFSDPTPGSGKVTLRPRSISRAEDAASGVALLKPHWWEAFENYLRLNKDDIQSYCSQCASGADEKCEAA